MEITGIAMLVMALAVSLPARAQQDQDHAEHYPPQVTQAAQGSTKPAPQEPAKPTSSPAMGGMMSMDNMMKGCQERHEAMAGMMDQMTKTIDEAQASNDMSKMRSAMDQMKTQMSQMREQMKMCMGMMEMMHKMMPTQDRGSEPAK